MRVSNAKNGPNARRRQLVFGLIATALWPITANSQNSQAPGDIEKGSDRRTPSANQVPNAEVRQDGLSIEAAKDGVVGGVGEGVRRLQNPPLEGVITLESQTILNTGKDILNSGLGKFLIPPFVRGVLNMVPPVIGGVLLEGACHLMGQYTEGKEGFWGDHEASDKWKRWRDKNYPLKICLLLGLVANTFGKRLVGLESWTEWLIFGSGAPLLLYWAIRKYNGYKGSKGSTGAQASRDDVEF